MTFLRVRSRRINEILGTLFALCLLCAGAGNTKAAQPPAPVSPHPSFSCDKPSALERVICDDPGLSDADRRMAAIYAAARLGALGDGGSQIAHAQKMWLKSRNQTCAAGDVRACLGKEYGVRLSELAVAALFNAPDIALAELKRQNATTFPLYEAMYRYATLDKPARSQSVTPLIAPVFQAIHDKPQASPLHDFSDAKSAAASDTAFATFLDVVSVSDYNVTLPCAAIVHRPGLIEALGAIYGGAIDGSLIQSDCESTLPATPKFNSLLVDVGSVQSDCEGTIRFTLGRSYQTTLVKLRLHQLVDLPKATQETREYPASLRFRREHTAQIQAAQEEIAHYYSAHFAVSEKAAADDAATAINVITGSAFDLCAFEGG